MGPQPGHGLRLHRRPSGRPGGQPAPVGSRNVGHRGLPEGRAIRGLLRCVQPAAGDLRGHLRLLSGQGPGVAGHDPLRGPDGVRLCPGHRAPGMRHAPEVLRGRIHRHGLPVHGQRPNAGLAIGRDRCDGRQGGGGDPAPRRRRGRAGRAGGRLRGAAPKPLHRRRTRFRGPGH